MPIASGICNISGLGRPPPTLFCPNSFASAMALPEVDVTCEGPLFINEPLWYRFGKRLTAGWGGPLKAGDGARTPKEIQAKCAPVGGVAAPVGDMKYTRAGGLEFNRKAHEGPV